MKSWVWPWDKAIVEVLYFFPFTVVALYEVTGKRTFLVFFVHIFINASVLLGILMLYPQLGKTQSIFKSSDDTEKGENGSENDTDTSEQTKLLFADIIGN